MKACPELDSGACPELDSGDSTTFRLHACHVGDSPSWASIN